MSDEFDIEDWVIVITNGVTVIGVPMQPGMGFLSPFYGFGVRIEDVRVGPNEVQRRIGYAAEPLLLLTSLKEFPVPDGAIRLPVRSLSPEEQRRIAGAVQAAEQQVLALRAASANISLSSQLPPGLRPPVAKVRS